MSTLTGVNDLKYKRAQVLGYQGKPLIQFAFLTTNGIPVALCIMAADANKKAHEITLRRLANINAVSWGKSGYEFLILGDTAFNELLRFAKHFQSKI